MRVFIGWSGAESSAIAMTLRGWLKMVCPALEPWMSEDVDKGARWSSEIAKRLRGSGAGIFVLTPDNLSSDWLHFEAGAISNVVNASVCTFLWGVAPARVERPLADFQPTRAGDKEDTRKLVKALWERVAQESPGRPPEESTGYTEKQLDRSFDHWWPDLETALSEIRKGAGKPMPVRPDVPQMVEEILLLVREVASRDREKSAPGHPPLSGAGSDVLEDLKGALRYGGMQRAVRAAEEALRQGAPQARVLEVLQSLASADEAQHILESARQRAFG
jgi:hypothetical protein